jgi:hypothetical protein
MQTYKCINGDFSAPALYGNELLLPVQSLNTPQYLLIKGKVMFEDDYTFAAGSDIIFLDNNSGFRVLNGKKLTLQGIDLHGCTKLWAGVEVLAGASISADDCTFEDAKAAIVLRNQSIVEATGNTFRKNVCGILGLSTNPGISSSSIFLGSAKGISGNTFWGNDQLLEPSIPNMIDIGINSNAPVSATNYPYTGIWIERINALTIGNVSTQSGVPLNEFKDFGQHAESDVSTQGIRSIESNLTITNSTFSNFGFYDPFNTLNFISADGIYAQNAGVANKQTTVVGLNQPLPLPTTNTFANCYRDIQTIGTNLSVTEVSSFKALGAIDASMDNSFQNAINCQIRNNRIDYFRAVGVQIGFYKPITINTEYNKLYDNDVVFDPAERFGVVISSGTNAEVILNNGRIANNDIRSRSVLFGGAFWGITLDQSSYLHIEQNSLVDNLAQTNLGTFYGIRTRQSPCNGTRMLFNTVRGAKIDYDFAFGIFVNESLNSVLNCNFVDDVNTGIGFFGNCNNADVRKNEFNYHNRGFSLGDPSVSPPLSVHQIGVQTNKENRWYGTNSPIEAFALNSASAQASVFNINSSNLNSIFWPLPRKIGALDDNFTWFVPSTIGQEANDDEVACYLTVPGPGGESSLANSDLQLLEGTYAPPLPYPALAWEAKWEFADRLHRNPDLQTTNSVVEQYYADHFDSTYSCFNRAYQRYLNRWQPNDPLYGVVQSYTDSLQNALAARYVLDSLLSVEWDENAHVHAQMLGADSMIEYLTTELEEAINNLNALVGQQVNTLIAEVNNISCTAAYETDMKEVVKTMLISHFTDGVLTNEQTTRIKAIADKCRYSGGYAVLLARGFFEPQETYSQDADCDAAPKISSVVQPVSGGVHIYPNPAKQAIAVELESKVQGGVLRVYNAQGLQVLQITLADQRTVLPVHTLPNGVYFLEVQMDNQPVIRKSIVVNH